MMATWFVTVLTLVPPGQQNPRVLLEQALDETAKITLENITLADAIGVLSEQTGVLIEMAPETFDLIPHGGETLIQKVEISGIPLREGLNRLFTPLGMTFVVEGDYVQVIPTDGLRCIGQTATWEELDTLAMLRGLDLRSESDVTKLRERLQLRVGAPHAESLLSETIQNIGAGEGDEVLSAACEQHGWAWCPLGSNIVIVPVARHYQHLLQVPIELRLNNRQLIDVVHAVGELTGVPVHLEPGSMAGLPTLMRENFSLIVSGQSAELALEKIAAATGLGYLVGPEGVLFYSPDDERPGVMQTTTNTQQLSGPADPYVGTIKRSLNNGITLEWHIRESEVPSDIRPLRNGDLEKAWEMIRRQQNAGKQDIGN